MTEQEIRKRAILKYDYNPKTGLLTSRATGRPVTRKTSNGYLIGKIGRKNFYVHRLAFLMVEGRWPVITDHINHTKDDNRWINLRETDINGNAQNHSIRSTNKTGVTGVENRGEHLWRAQLVRDGKRVRSNWFKTRDDAVAQRDEYVRKWLSGEW